MSELSPDYSQILKQQIITGLFPDSQTNLPPAVTFGLINEEYLVLISYIE